MPMSELESLSSLSDFRARKFLLDQIRLKLEVEKKLNNPDLTVEMEIQYKAALKNIKENINRFRMSGIVDLT